MRDFINIGSVPCDEDCQQVPYSDYDLMLRECKQYIDAIRKVVGQEPVGAEVGMVAPTKEIEKDVASDMV